MANDTRTPWYDPRTKEQYGWRTCPTCEGTGINPRWITQVCPKCNGEKRVPK